MKILFLHNKYISPGGEDMVFESEANMLLNAGHNVKKLVFGNNSLLDKRFFSKITFFFQSIYNFHSAKLIKEAIQEFHPDIIHVHNFFYLLSPSVFFISSRYRTPIVLTLHNYRLVCPSANLLYKNEIYLKSINKIFPLDAILKGVFKKSILYTFQLALITGIHKLIGTWRNKVNAYITLSEFSKKIYESSSLHIEKDKFFIKQNFTQDFGFNLENRKKYFLYVGRLSQEKGLNILIEAAKKLPDVSFRIIGEGPLKNETICLSNIEYLGFRDKPYIIDQLKYARALLFPSIWYEGMPMVILEAFSCATPVISSNIGVQSLLVKNGVNGLQFKSGDSNDLAFQILKLKNDDLFYSKLCVESRNEFLSNYTEKTNLKLLLDIYSIVINKSKNRKSKQERKGVPSSKDSDANDSVQLIYPN